MYGGLDLASVGRVAAARHRIIGATQLHHLAGRVLHRLPAGDEIRIAQPHLGAGRKPEELLRRVLHEIVALDIELTGETDAARAGRRIVGMVDRLELLTLSLGIVLDHDLERPQYGHATL